MEPGHKYGGWDNFRLFFSPALDLVLVDIDEAPQRTVIYFFHFIREKTGWKFSHAPMILEALAADAFSAAGLPSAVASFEVDFLLAFFHESLRRWLVRQRFMLFGSVFSKEFVFDRDNRPGLAGASLLPVGRSECLLPATLLIFSVSRWPKRMPGLE
jgi:hypothetical protein